MSDYQMSGMSHYSSGFGIPGIVVITQSHQDADATGADVNAPEQKNPVTTTVKVK